MVLITKNVVSSIWGGEVLIPFSVQCLGYCCEGLLSSAPSTWSFFSRIRNKEMHKKSFESNKDKLRNTRIFFSPTQQREVELSAKIDHGCFLGFLQIRDFPETASPWKQSTGRSVPLFQPSSNSYPRALSGALAPGLRLTHDPGRHTPESGRSRRGSARPQPQRGGASGVLERPRAAGAGPGSWGWSRGSRAAPPASGLGRRWPSFARGRWPRVLSSGGDAQAGRLPLRSRVPPVRSPRSPPGASSSHGDEFVCGGPACGGRAGGPPRG